MLGNVLAGQSWGSTSVINDSLYGIFIKTIRIYDMGALK